jgi:TP901 family phage tail tape measure protein
MSSGDLTAKFVLLLEDRLSAGLGRLQERLDQIAGATRRIAAPGLDAMARALGQIGEAGGRATADMARLGEAAQAAGREGQAALDGLARRLDAVQRQASQPLRLGFAGGGGGGAGGIPVPPLDGGGHGAGGLGEHLERVNRAGEAAAGGIFGALAAGFGIGEAVEKASELDNILRHIAITTGAVGAAGDRMVAQLRQQYQSLARETGQGTNAIAEAGFYLIQAGLAPDVVDRLTRQSARIATAYNADPQEVAKTAFVLSEQLHIDPAGMGGSLASLALAGKQSHILFPEMAALFPQIAAEGVNAGETGRGGVDRLAAMLAIARKNTATGGEAATNMRDFLGQLNSPFETKHFAGLGVDLPALMKNAKLQGVDPIEAVLANVQQVTHGDPQLLGRLFHNEQSRGFVLAMLQHHDEYVALLRQLGHADEGMLGQDFGEGLKSLHVQIGQFSAEVDNLVTRVGGALAPVMRGAAFVLGMVNDAFAVLDSVLPGASGALIAVVGSLMALAGAAGAARLVLPFFAAGIEAIGAVLALVLSPVGLVIGAVVALAVAADLVWRHWGHLGEFFGGLWNDVKGRFAAFVAWVDGWSGGLGTRILAGIRAGWAALVAGFSALFADLMGPVHAFENSWVGRHLGLAAAPAAGPPAGAAPPPGQVGGQITIRVDGPGQVTGVQSVNPAVPIVPAAGRLIPVDRGDTVGRQ